MTAAAYLVVDSGGFLRNAPLRDMAENVVTLREVVDEIRDKETRHRLQVLPYELKFKDANIKALQHVMEFSKKTGDYGSLSATDLKVLAVTYQLEKEHVGTDHLHKEPQSKPTVNFYKPGIASTTTTNGGAGAQLPGFYRPNSSEEEGEEEEDGVNETEEDEQEHRNYDSGEQRFLSCPEPPPDDADADQFRSSLYWAEPLPCIDLGHIAASPPSSSAAATEADAPEFASHNFWREEIGSVPADELATAALESKELTAHNIAARRRRSPAEVSDGSSGCDDDDGDDADDEGWITPGNIAAKKRELCGAADAPDKVAVACVTTDFAMQNVLKQLGLNVMSVDGLLIRQTKTWLLRCYACFKTTSLMGKQFCPRCGNRTLKRVSVTLDVDGSQRIHISARRQLTGRGKKFSLPKPKGGKHGVSPVVCEDQPQAHQRSTRKARERTTALDPDYTAGQSPFALHDVTSRSATIGVPGRGAMAHKYWLQRNPNAATRGTGNRKKKK